MNVKQEPEWRKSFVLRAYVHNSKLKNAAIRMVFQYWVTFLQLFTYIYPSFLVFTYVYSCLPMFTRVYLCLKQFIRACLPMFSNVL